MLRFPRLSLIALRFVKALGNYCRSSSMILKLGLVFFFNISSAQSENIQLLNIGPPFRTEEGVG